MKKTLLTLALAGATAAAFGQGKVSLQMDLPIIWADASHMLAADAGLAGAVIANTNNVASHIVLEVGLYGGTSSTSLSLVGSAILNPLVGNGTPNGYIPVTHISLAAPFSSATAWFQVKIWDSFYATYEAQEAAGVMGTDYSGINNIFTMNPGTSISYPPINGGGNSTWAAAGNEVSMVVGVVPEPTTVALAGLGAAALLIFRRRK